MLNTMRSIASGYIAKALLLFLVLTFAIWGIGDIFTNAGASYAARVGNATISVGEFERSKAMIARQMQAMGIEGADANNMSVNILRQLVQQQLTLQAVDDLGLVVNNDLLAKQLTGKLEYQNVDGSFNGKGFQNMLANMRMSEGQFLDQQRKETATKFLLASLEMNDVVPPTSVMTLVASSNSETRDAVLITIPSHPATNRVTDDAIKADYEANKSALYMEPEKRTLEYVTLNPADVNALLDAAITPDMLRDAQTANPKASHEQIIAELRAEKRDSVLRQVTNAVEDALAAGSSLGEAVAKSGIKATSQLLADVNEAKAKHETNDVTKTVTSQGLRLSEGEISGLITTPKGTMVMVSVKSITPPTPKPLEAVKTDIKLRVAQQVARVEALEKVQKFKDALNQEGATTHWQKIANDMGLPTRRMANLSRPSTEDGKVPASNPALPTALHQAIFEREVGQVAGPLASANGDQTLALVAARHPVKPDLSTKALEKIAKQLTETINQQVQGRAFTSFAEQHTVKVNDALLAQSVGTQE